MSETSRSEPMTGGQALARQLCRQGVEVIFGLPGDQLMTALDALVDTPEIRYIVTRHEQGTTYMADGYARASGRPGVAMVVPGVGVYNAASGLATAYACSSPVLLLAGQVNRHGIGKDLGLLHDIHDQLDVVRPITKWAERVVEPHAIPGAIREAFRQMTTGRPRPTEVEIPPEAFAETESVTLVDPASVEPVAADPDLVAKAADVLASSCTPLVIAGGGVVLGDATEGLRRVVELLQSPVLTTREGKGAIDDRNPLSVGTAWVNRRVQPLVDRADVVLAVGTRGQGMGLSKGQLLIHLDVDPDQIGRNHPAEIALAGDAQATLELLEAALTERAVRRESRTEEARATRARVEDQLRAIGPQAHMVELLRQGVPDDGILVCDTTTVAYMCHMHYPVYAPRTYLSTSYMGTLGFGFPASLGVKVASPTGPWSRSWATAGSSLPPPNWRRPSNTASTRSRWSSTTPRTATPIGTSARSSTDGSWAPSCATPTGWLWPVRSEPTG